jgi:hypothetical protein
MMSCRQIGRSILSQCRSLPQYHSIVSIRILRGSIIVPQIRFCTTAPEKQDTTNNKNENLPIRRIVQDDDDYYDDYAGGGDSKGYKRYLSYLLYLSIGSVITYAAYSISVELFGRAAPSNLFNETFELVRVNDEVLCLIYFMGYPHCTLGYAHDR